MISNDNIVFTERRPNPDYGPVKYELNEIEVLELYYAEPRLAALMEMDIIRLIDKHLVVNLRDFITPKTHHLTARAKRNLSSCCVGIQYIDKKYSHGSSVACTLDMLLQATGFLENTEAVDGEQSYEDQKREDSKIDAEINRLNKMICEMPGSFSGSLKYLMEKKGYTEEVLAEEAWLSLSTIKQYRQKEDKEKTLKTVTAISIGLHLHPWLTEELLRKAGIIPKATKQDGAYRYLYTFLYKNSIEDCNKYLKSQKLQEFVQRENKSRPKAKAR